MYIDAGKLNKRVQFIATIKQLNSSGEVTSEYEEVVRECWAQFSQTSGTELIKANADFGEAKVRFLVRYHPRVLDRRLKLRYDGRDYEVKYVNTYGDGMRYVELWCERKTAGGTV